MNMRDLSIAVIIASTKRPKELSRWGAHIHRQSVAPSHVVYSIVNDSDLAESAEIFPGTIIVKGPAGLPAQRNRALELVVDKCDIVAFFDDDYVPTSDCLKNISILFSKYPEIAGANGVIIEDGIKTIGIPYDQACALISAYERRTKAGIDLLEDLTGLYGCNMVFRSVCIGRCRFDEQLPLYAWQEDIDFSAQIKASGRIVRSNAFAGVHQGVKYGRETGARIGYSQIINPVYLSRKGTMSRRYASKLIIKNALSNIIRFFWEEPWIDRRGRLKGNLVAIRDIAMGKVEPGRILQL